MKKTRRILLGILVINGVWVAWAAGVLADAHFSFLNGADLGMGVGARAMGVGGAFTARADDASAVFWNPAGLSRLDGHRAMFSSHLPFGLDAAALVVKPRFWHLDRYGLALGLGHVNRLTFKADSGTTVWHSQALHLADLSMLDVEDDFTGSIHSTTRDLRVSLAFKVPRVPDLRMGVSVVHVR